MPCCWAILLTAAAISAISIVMVGSAYFLLNTFLNQFLMKFKQCALGLSLSLLSSKLSCRCLFMRYLLYPAHKQVQSSEMRPMSPKIYPSMPSTLVQDRQYSSAVEDLYSLKVTRPRYKPPLTSVVISQNGNMNVDVQLMSEKSAWGKIESSVVTSTFVTGTEYVNVLRVSIYTRGWLFTTRESCLNSLSVELNTSSWLPFRNMKGTRPGVKVWLQPGTYLSHRSKQKYHSYNLLQLSLKKAMLLHVRVYSVKLGGHSSSRLSSLHGYIGSRSNYPAFKLAFFLFMIADRIQLIMLFCPSFPSTSIFLSHRNRAYMGTIPQRAYSSYGTITYVLFSPSPSGRAIPNATPSLGMLTVEQSLLAKVDKRSSDFLSRSMPLDMMSQAVITSMTRPRTPPRKFFCSVFLLQCRAGAAGLRSRDEILSTMPINTVHYYNQPLALMSDYMQTYQCFTAIKGYNMEQSPK